MKQNIKIEIPNGFEAKYNPETLRIELIKKNSKPKTWEEFCKNYPNKVGECWIIGNSEIKNCQDPIKRNSNWDRNLCISKEEVEAFIALMRLRQLRKAWIGDWEPNWEDPIEAKYVIYSRDKIIIVDVNRTVKRSLSFPTKKMAEEFLDCFRDLIETAEILL